MDERVACVREWVANIFFYNDLKGPSVSGFFRFLARVGDGMMRMQIVKIKFRGESDEASAL